MYYTYYILAAYDKLCTNIQFIFHLCEGCLGLTTILLPSR